MVHEELERILSSPAFAQSQRLIRFLRFVVEQALDEKGDQLKEYLIGIAVFDRTGGYDPRTDPIVRVEAGRLRTKLREYYSTEGSQDPIVIELPKGSYIPLIRRRDVRSPTRRLGRVPTRKVIPILLVIIAVFLGALATYLYIENRQLREAALQDTTSLVSAQLAPLWGHFLSKGKEIHVVFGSPFFLAAPEYRMFLRAYDINEPMGLESDPAIQRLRDRLGRITGPRYDYALVGETLALVRLTSFFAASGVKVKAFEAQRTNWDSIQAGNIILLGAPRMNHLLRRFPHSMDFEWESENAVRNRRPEKGERAVYEARFHEGFYDLDPASWQNAFTYVIVGSFHGFVPNREILILSAHGGPGVLGAVEFLTRPETVGPLMSRITPQKTDKKVYFQLLLRVYVDRGVPIRTEYVTHHLKTYPPSDLREQ